MNLIFLAILLSCFAFVNVLPKTFHQYILTQSISNNKEIKWEKPTKLQGVYKVLLVIFLKSSVQEGDIVLSVENGGNSTKLLYGSPKTVDLPQLIIRESVMVNPGEELKILYKGNGILSIQEKPSSYIMLTQQTETIVTEGSTGTTVAERSIGTTVAERSTGIIVAAVITIVMEYRRW